MSSAKVAGAGLVSRLAGLVRDMILGSYFGASNLLDAYFVALSIPTILQTAIGSTLTGALVATYSRLLGRGEQEKAARFGSLVLFGALGTGAVLAMVAFAGAGWLVRLIAPGLDAVTAGYAATMLRIVAPITIFALTDFWSTSLLNSNKRFGVPAVVGLPRSTLIMVAVLLTAGTYHIWGLVWGTVAAFFTASTWLLVTAVRATELRRPQPSRERKDLLFLLRLSWPAVIGSLARKSGVVVDQILGSGLGPGTISALAFANKLATVPVALVGNAIATVISPTLARWAVKPEPEFGPEAVTAESLPASETSTSPSDSESFPASKGVAEKVFRLTLQGLTATTLVLAPIVGALIALRLPTVSIIFGRGSFTSEAVQATATALAFYSLAIIPQSCQSLTARAFYALGDSRTPMKVSLLSVPVKVAVSFAATPLLGIGGIVLGTMAATSFYLTFLSIALAHKLHQVAGPEFWRNLGKIALATGAGLVLGSAALKGTAPALAGLGSGLLFNLATLVVFGGVSFAIYIAVIFAWRVPEALAAWEAVRERLRL